MNRKTSRKNSKLTMIALAGALSVSLISTPVIALAQESNDNNQIGIIIETDPKKVACHIKENDNVITVDIVVDNELVSTVSKEEIETLLDSDYEVVPLGKENVNLLFLEKAYYIELGKYNADYWTDENNETMEIIKNIESLKITIGGVEIQNMEKYEFINYLNSVPIDEKVYVSTETKIMELTIEDLKRAFYVSEGIGKRREETFIIIILVAFSIVSCLGLAVASSYADDYPHY